jgi:hypothetical protein
MNNEQASRDIREEAGVDPRFLIDGIPGLLLPALTSEAAAIFKLLEEKGDAFRSGDVLKSSMDTPLEEVKVPLHADSKRMAKSEDPFDSEMKTPADDVMEGLPELSLFLETEATYRFMDCTVTDSGFEIKPVADGDLILEIREEKEENDYYFSIKAHRDTVVTVPWTDIQNARPCTLIATYMLPSGAKQTLEFRLENKPD